MNTQTRILVIHSRPTISIISNSSITAIRMALAILFDEAIDCSKLKFDCVNDGVALRSYVFHNIATGLLVILVEQIGLSSVSILTAPMLGLCLW